MNIQSNRNARMIMFVVFAGLTLSWFSAAKVNAQQKAVAAKTNEAALPKTRSLMWKATAQNGKTVYLLGSVHLATKAFYPMPPEIEAAFAESTVLAVEADITKVDAAQTSALVQKYGMYAGDDTLWKHISPATAEKLKKFNADNGIPAEAFAKLKPWMISLTVSLVPLLRNGFDASLGIDKYFLDKAKDKKRIAEIESADYQLKLLSGQTEAEQEKFLLSALNQVADIKTYIDLLQNSWLEGDAEKLEAAFAQMNVAAPDAQKMLLDDRNPKMADFAENCLKGTERCFVVVGAGHLVGKKGVVQLLKNKNYKVEQISVTPPRKKAETN